MGSISIVNVFNNVYKSIIENQIIVKNLYYSSDNFNDDPVDNPDLTGVIMSKYIKKLSADYVIDEISADNPEKRGYMTTFMDDADRMENPFASSIGIRIEIYMPVRGYEEHQFRMVAIVEQLNSMFQQKKIGGSIGRLILSNSFNIASPADGYVGYAHIFEAGNVISGQ